MATDVERRILHRSEMLETRDGIAHFLSTGYGMPSLGSGG
jgi:hypothetical protein